MFNKIRIKLFPVMCLLVTLLVLQPSNQEAIAQSGNQIGTLDTIHYIPPFYGRSQFGTHYLLLSTIETTPFVVTITNGDGSIVQTVNLSKTSPQQINLSQSPYGGAAANSFGLVAANQLGQVNQFDGLVLTAAKPFYANVRINAGPQGLSLTAKGQVALGTRFRAGHIFNGSHSSSSNFISVMASENNTTINFSDITSGVTFVNGTPSSVTLQQHDSYVVAVHTDAALANPMGLIGTLITADNPVAVVTGSWTTALSVPGVATDIGADQILPTNYLGTEYIVAKGEATTNSEGLERPLVVAEFDNTQIFLNGSTTAIATINIGEHFLIPASNFTTSDTMYIQTSQPAYLYQSTSANNKNGQGMNFIPPLDDSIATQDVIIPHVGLLGTATIDIVSPSGAQVWVDGTLLTGGQSVSTSGWEIYSVTKSGATTNVEITSDKPTQVSLTVVAGVRGAAAYFSGVPNRDEDNDGIPNDGDLCPNTAASQSVNSQGCSTSQIGRITIVKEVNPAHGQDFEFSNTIDQLNFFLDDDGDDGNDLSNTKVFDDVPNSTTYDIVEILPSGWELQSANCQGATNSTITNIVDGVRIALEGTEQIVCTFTNAEEVTYVELAFFIATSTADGTLITWSTAAEIDNAGFNLYRGNSADGPWSKVNHELILAQGASLESTTYTFTDNASTPYYMLEDIDTAGMNTRHGPITVGNYTVDGSTNTSHEIFLPLLQ